MRDYRDAKPMAHTLRKALKAKSITISHAEALELVAQSLGVRGWQVLSAAIASEPRATKVEGNEGAVAPRAPPSTLYCSFCGKSQHVVAKLIAGPGVFICDECVDLCDDIILGESPGLDENADEALASKTVDELIRLKVKANKSLGHGRNLLELISAAARRGAESPTPPNGSRPDPQWNFILRKTPDERLAYAREVEQRVSLVEGVIEALTSALRRRGVQVPKPPT